MNVAVTLEEVGQGALPTASEAGPAPKRIVVTYGFWIFLLSDIVMFAALFAAYAVLVRATAGGPTGVQLFNQASVALETVTTGGGSRFRFEPPCHHFWIVGKPSSTRLGKSCASFGSKVASRGPTAGDCVAPSSQFVGLKSNRAIPRSQLVLGAQSSRPGRTHWKG